MFLIVAAVAYADCSLTSAADPLGSWVELSGFSQKEPDTAVSTQASVPESETAVGLLPTVDVSCRECESGSSRQFYLSGIVGASFASLASGGENTAGGFTNTGNASSNVFTGGSAIGMAIDRPFGSLRMEVEGRARSLVAGETNSLLPTLYDVRAADGWSVMANLWRDYFFNDTFGIYGGGGIGAGGYRLTVSDPTPTSGYAQAGAFAWQIGAGITCRASDRVTLDLGYRFFDLGPSSIPLFDVSGAPTGSFSSTLTASEILLSVRIYEPFRQWR